MFNSFDKTLMFLFIPADLVILNDLAIFAFVQKKNGGPLLPHFSFLYSYRG